MSVATGTSSVDTAWQEQLRSLEEAEKWEGSHIYLPPKLQPAYAEVMARFTLQQRISIYKMLFNLNWEFDHCSNFLGMFEKTSSDDITVLLSFLVSFPVQRLSVVSNLLIRSSQVLIQEILKQFSLEEFSALISMIQYLTLHEIDMLVQICQDNYSFTEFVAMMKFCDEPHAKQCRLCRLKRIETLEYKLTRKQVPDNIVRLSL